MCLLGLKTESRKRSKEYSDFSKSKYALQLNTVKDLRYKSNVKKLTLLEREKLLSNNPLVGLDFVIPVRKLTVDKSYKLSSGVSVPVELDLERESVVKVYVKPENRVSIANLSSGAQRLYLHILHKVEYGMDYVEINVVGYMKENRVGSVNTYKKALDELIRYYFIAQSKIKGVYWINPRLFFRGNRKDKYPKNVKIK